MWIDLHLSFGAGQIMIYDATELNEVTSLIEKTYPNDERIDVRPYRIDMSDLCNETNLFKQYINLNISLTSKMNLNKICEKFLNHGFKEKIKLRFYHEQITGNDCFTVLKNKYEFIAYYDLDEFVYPRISDNQNSSTFNCINSNQVCKDNTFVNSSITSISNNYFYKYIHNLIEKRRKIRKNPKLSDLRSVNFHHAGYIIPDDRENKLMNDLGSIIKRLDSNQSENIFPIILFLNIPPSTRGHRFIIEKEDISYIKDLYKSYNSLMPCLKDSYLKKINKLDKIFVRYMFYLTEINERYGKAIHYYKNVKTISAHQATDYHEKSWAFSTYYDPNHYLSHFRGNMTKLYEKNFNGSISKLNIDHEYLFFILKNHANVCGI